MIEKINAPTRPVVRNWLRYTVKAGLLAASLAVFPLAANAFPSILNGTFDTDLTGWTANQSPCGSFVGISNLNGNPPRSARLNNCGAASSDPTLSQTVSGFTIGQQYTLSWQTRLHINSGNSGNGASFGVFLGDISANEIILDLSENLTDSFVFDSVSFIATETIHIIRFAAELDARTPGVPNTSDVSYFLDNVSLGDPPANVLPEPPSLTLFTLGLLGLGVAWRRKRKNENFAISILPRLRNY